VDTFALIVIGTLAVAVLALVGLGLWSPRRASDITDKDRHKRWVTQSEIEEKDIPQMVEGQNKYRRARGEADITEADAEGQAAVGQRDSIARAKRTVRKRSS
jgi:FtsZ-interacting cell division protein ZipA